MRKLLSLFGLIAMASVLFIGCPQTPTDIEYTITFDSNGGSAVEPQTVKSGEKRKNLMILYMMDIN